MRASSARHQAVLPRDGDHLQAVPAPVHVALDAVRPASQHASITSFHSCPPSIPCTSLRNYSTIALGGQVEVLEGKYGRRRSSHRTARPSSGSLTIKRPITKGITPPRWDSRGPAEG